MDTVTGTGPTGADTAPEHADHGGHEGHGAAHGRGHGTAAATPGGLRASERGYTLVPPSEPLPVGAETDFRFRVLGPDGPPWTRYERAHDKDLHLIVVRRDLSGSGTCTPYSAPTARGASP